MREVFSWLFETITEAWVESKVPQVVTTVVGIAVLAVLGLGLVASDQTVAIVTWTLVGIGGLIGFAFLAGVIYLVFFQE